MTINHIDQLAQWYADAEQITKTNLPNKGDTLIYPRRTSGYIIESDGGGWTPGLVPPTGEVVRILERASKPKPAWTDAVAVIASRDLDRNETITGVWTPDGTPDAWESQEGIIVSPESLYNVTPLIEAKVTDEMVDRAWAASKRWEFGGVSKPAARAMLSAALGFEAE